MSTHFDTLETRDESEREAALMAALRAQVALAQAKAPGMAKHLGDVDAASLTDRAALARLPVLRKSDLAGLQKSDPPLGGLSARAHQDFELLFQSPGPIYEPGMATSPDWWRFGRAFHAAGFGKGDLVHNSFAYHLTPAGHMMESGARAAGATVLAGGIGNTEAQAAAAADLGATGYAGTPDFLKVMLDKAGELGRDLSRITRALVGGGPLFPAMRQEYRDRGITCLQNYGTADLGLIAYETAAKDGSPNQGMVVEEGAIVEIVRPGTGDPVPAGEVGEVLVTIINPDYPLIRFATGDLSAVLAGASPCGRTNMRIKGWMGRADQTAKVKGMFVRPEQIAEILRRHPEVAKARLTIDRRRDQDVMSLAIEADMQGGAEAVRDTMRAVLKLRGEVTVQAIGSLPNDGKVIDDVRTFD